MDLEEFPYRILLAHLNDRQMFVVPGSDFGGPDKVRVHFQAASLGLFLDEVGNVYPVLRSGGFDVPARLSWDTEAGRRDEFASLAKVVNLALAGRRLLAVGAPEYPQQGRPLVWDAVLLSILETPGPGLQHFIRGPILHAWDNRGIAAWFMSSDPRAKDELKRLASGDQPRTARIRREAQARLDPRAYRDVLISAIAEQTLPLVSGGADPLAPLGHLLVWRDEPVYVPAGSKAHVSWREARTAVQRELEHEVFGSGINSARSRWQFSTFGDASGWDADLGPTEAYSDAPFEADAWIRRIQADLEPDERIVLSTRRELFEAGLDATLPAVADCIGQDLKDVQAIWKRILRKAHRSPRV